jgi:hypothetical protein
MLLGKGKADDTTGKVGIKRKAAPVDRVVSKHQKLEEALEVDKIKERKSTSICQAGSPQFTSPCSSCQGDEAGISV